MNLHLPYVPREAFLPFHNRTKRWATLVCHRRAGKTVALVNDLVIGGLECQKENPQLAYIAPTYPMAKKIAWEYLKHYSGPLIHQAHESELKITLKVNNIKIFLLGAEKADNLRGIYLDGTALDEYAMMRPTVWSQVVSPALADREGWAVFSGTPMGKNHFYDLVRLSQAKPEEWFHLTLRADTSGILAPEELARLKSQMDDSDYEQEMLCSFQAALRGAIYGIEMDRAEADGRINDFALDPDLPVDAICDLGFADDTTVGFFQVRPGGVLVHETLANNEVDWEWYLDEMESRNVRDIWLPPDAKAKNLQTGRSIVEQTVKRGYRPQIVPDHKVRDGIAAFRKLLPYVYFNKSLTSGGVEALKSYRRAWDEKLGCYKDHPIHDWSSHYADMFRYMGVAFTNIRPMRSRIVVPAQYARNANYGFNLEDLFNDRATNPGLSLEQ